MRLKFRALVSHYGRHRAARIPGQLARQRFVYCPGCEADTAVTIHGNALLCAAGHQLSGGGR